jgi:site-specific DNA-cytosine methylase
MTPGELLSLQGFKKEYGQLLLNNGITKEKIGFMSGNSVTVSVLEYIFKNLIEKYSKEFYAEENVVNY